MRTLLLGKRRVYLALLLASLLCCTEPNTAPLTPAQQRPCFADWNLPKSLRDKLPYLRRLHLPKEVDRLDWLPDQLQHVTLQNSNLKAIEALPASLEILDLDSGRKLKHLSNSKIGLRALNIQTTHITDLTPFFVEARSEQNSVETLAIGASDGTSFELTLPEEITSLTSLVLLKSSYEVFLLPTLRQLTLEGQSFGPSTEIPSDVTDLTLVNTTHDEESIRGLTCSPEKLSIIRPTLFGSTKKEISEGDEAGAEENGLPDGLLELTLQLGGGEAARAYLPNLEGPLRRLTLRKGNFIPYPNDSLPGSLELLDLADSGTLDSRKQLPTPNASLTGLALHVNNPMLEREKVAGQLPEDLVLSLISDSVQAASPFSKQIRYLVICDHTASSIDLRTEDYPLLRQLDLSCSRNIERIQHLPDSLEELSLQGLDVSAIPLALPSKLRVVDLRDMKGSLKLDSFTPLKDLRAVLLTADPRIDLGPLPSTVTDLYFLEGGKGDIELWNHFSRATNTAPYRNYRYE